jgi:ABC-type lipoprotein release transport system permease subunit
MLADPRHVIRALARSSGFTRLAGYVPARRATRINPVTARHAE